jgi:hypothetical protein
MVLEYLTIWDLVDDMVLDPAILINTFRTSLRVAATAANLPMRPSSLVLSSDSLLGSKSTRVGLL